MTYGHHSAYEEYLLAECDRLRKALETIVAFGHAYVHAEDMYEVAREALDPSKTPS